MKRREDNKKKYAIVLITLFIVFSMVISIFAVVLDNQSNTLRYNKHKFLMTDNGYKTKISDKYMDFYFYPSELERIPMDSNIKNIIDISQGIAFAFDPNTNITDNLLYIDIMRYDLSNQVDKPIYFAVTNYSEKYALPVIGCENATYAIPIFVINDSIDTSFRISDTNPYCVVVNAKLRDIIAAKDRFVYTYYGVMNYEYS